MPVVRDIMTQPVVTVSPDTKLIEAARTLCEGDVGGAPVIASSGELVGFVSKTDLFDVLFDEAVRRAPVAEYMTRDVNVSRPDDTLAEAARLLALYNIRRLPVVEENGKLVGIVTRRDLMNYMLRTGEALTDPLIELIPSIAPMT